MKNKDALGSPKRFGHNWKKFSNLTELYEEQFIEWIKPLSKDSFNGKKVLDAGCGIGRNSFYALNYGAKQVYAFDVEQSTVEIAKNNLSNFENSKVFTDSIYDLTNLNNESFDIVFCIGVIHHLSSPTEAVENLYQKVKKNGKLLIWIYGKEGNERLLTLLKPIRFFTTKLPYFLVAWIGKLLTLALYLILKILPTKSEYWNRAKKMEFWHLEQILIDQLIPKIAIYYSKVELKNLYKNLNYSDLEIKHTNQNSWSILITK